MSRLPFLLPALVLSLVGSAPAQSCAGATGTLTVTPDACVQPGDTISIDSCGASGAIALLAVSESAGSTTIGPFGPFPAVTLCVGEPFVILPLGFTGADGCAGFDLTIPPGATLPGDVNLVLQGVFIDFNFTPPSGLSFTVVTTNTDTLCL
jgi:hypothetical protein